MTSKVLDWPVRECSGSVVECLTRDRGCGFEPHWHHCVLSLSKTHLCLLSAGSTQEDLSQKNVDWNIKNQIKQKMKLYIDTFSLRPSLLYEHCMEVDEDSD